MADWVVGICVVGYFFSGVFFGAVAHTLLVLEHNSQSQFWFGALWPLVLFVVCIAAPVVWISLNLVRIGNAIGTRTRGAVGAWAEKMDESWGK